jgi:hypothetical protein
MLVSMLFIFLTLFGKVARVLSAEMPLPMSNLRAELSHSPKASSGIEIQKCWWDLSPLVDPVGLRLLTLV